MRITTLLAVLFAGLIAGAASTTGPAAASEITGSINRGPSGLALPRFVSLKASRVNLRIGPGKDYAIDWMYLKPGLPMEIIQEYGNWRRVRDAAGTEGWIYGSLLSGRRTAAAAPWQETRSALIPLRAEPTDQAPTVARLEPGAIGSVKACDGTWCEMEFSGHKGWISQSLVWGVYPDETIER